MPKNHKTEKSTIRDRKENWWEWDGDNKWCDWCSNVNTLSYTSMKLSKRAGEMTWELKRLLLQRTGVQFPALTLVGSQLPMSLAPWEPMSSSGLHGYSQHGTHSHKHANMNKKTNKSNWRAKANNKEGIENHENFVFLFKVCSPSSAFCNVSWEKKEDSDFMFITPGVGKQMWTSVFKCVKAERVGSHKWELTHWKGGMKVIAAWDRAWMRQLWKKREH